MILKSVLNDQFGHAAEGMGEGFSGGFSGGGFSDILEIFLRSLEILGATTGERGSDLQYNMEISFEDAAFGHSTEVDLSWKPAKLVED